MTQQQSDVLPNIGRVATDTIDGLAIRYARSGASEGLPILLTAPWPESLYAFHHVMPRLAGAHPLIAVDLPGFGRSQSRPDVMAPEAMGNFVIALLDHFGIGRTHVVAPDVGTLAVLFAAAKQSGRFESLVVGGGAARVDLAAGSLNELIHSPTGAFASVDGADRVRNYLTHAAELTQAAIIEDFRAASAGRRFEEATQYVRGYIADLPKLAAALPGINTPTLIIAGKSDPIVPPANGQFLANRLPRNRYVLLDAQHRVWEEAAADYADALLSWFGGGYRRL
ncbi:MAG TPA: alpha/beta hydrolase [Stellaceae bacterium]|jgi:pimeloyl-ACP methyl ester carboxylesterase|nr:alpha/beta hydrolase [Stellaceae bacterium]